MTFSPRLEINVALQCSSDSFPHMVMYILCVKNYQNYISEHSCLPIVGRLFYNVRKLHGPRISEGNISISKNVFGVSQMIRFFLNPHFSISYRFLL